MLDISGLDKVELLERLWERQKLAELYVYCGMGRVFDEKEAKIAVSDYIDYFCEKPIKTDLSQDSVDTQEYNKIAGDNAFENIVADMRREISDECVIRFYNSLIVGRW